MDESETKPDMRSEAGTQQRSSTPPNGSGNEFAIPSAIGKRLKAYYDDVASEPVPDRFLSLLEQLDKAESSSKSGNE